MPLRVGLIGLADGLLHLRACREVEGLHLAAICDRGTEQLGDVARRFDISVAVTDDEKLLQADDLDAVLLCGSLRRRRQQIVSALQHGLHVYCAGPPGVTRADCQSLRTAASAHPDSRLMIGCLERFHPFFQAAHRVCREGRLGTVYAIQIAQFHPGHEFLAPRTAKTDPSLAAHPLLDLGHVCFDLANWLAGPPTAVAAQLEQRVLLQLPFEDTARANWTAANGAAVGLLFALGARRPPAITLQVLGTEGSLAGSSSGPRNQYWTVSGPDITRHDLSNDPTAGLIPASLQEFVNAIAEERAPSPDLGDGLLAVEAACAALDSAQADGRPAPIRS